MSLLPKSFKTNDIVFCFPRNSFARVLSVDFGEIHLKDWTNHDPVYKKDTKPGCTTIWIKLEKFYADDLIQIDGIFDIVGFLIKKCS